MTQNIYAPFDLSFHLFFCIAATLIYAVQFFRKGYPHYILMIIAIDITLVAQFTASEKHIIILGIVEILLLAVIFILMARISLKRKRANLLALRDNNSSPKTPRKKHFVDDAFDDNNS